jgi:hypothetical protein
MPTFNIYPNFSFTLEAKDKEEAEQKTMELLKNFTRNFDFTIEEQID